MILEKVYASEVAFFQKAFKRSPLFSGFQPLAIQSGNPGTTAIGRTFDCGTPPANLSARLQRQHRAKLLRA
ncbi:hypothetical protein MU1_02480 [Paenibacillus glycanilyticus]|uniref:Uncharacterized protein n=1 Tax=Paenibacillus glycanilyticus TaxID=126569 RepID=A0ABQ6G4P8_9BACL|nr:hypothetical protein MU1_02480 [Paenibacillus glycanilyticus]